MKETCSHVANKFQLIDMETAETVSMIGQYIFSET